MSVLLTATMRSVGNEMNAANIYEDNAPSLSFHSNRFIYRGGSDIEGSHCSSRHAFNDQCTSFDIENIDTMTGTVKSGNGIGNMLDTAVDPCFGCLTSWYNENIYVPYLLPILSNQKLRLYVQRFLGSLNPLTAGGLILLFAVLVYGYCYVILSLFLTTERENNGRGLPRRIVWT